MTIEELIAEEVSDLTTELQSEPDFDSAVLEIKVKNVVKEVMQRRNYRATKYTTEQIAEDLYTFYSVIHDVALYDYNKIGAEGESSHSENGISRHYVERDKLLGNVYSFVTVL